MTKQEFDSLRVGSKITNSNGSWNGVVMEVISPETIRVYWKRVSGEVIDDEYTFEEVESWARFVSNPEVAVGLEELI